MNNRFFRAIVLPILSLVMLWVSANAESIKLDGWNYSLNEGKADKVSHSNDLSTLSISADGSVSADFKSPSIPLADKYYTLSFDAWGTGGSGLTSGLSFINTDYNIPSAKKRLSFTFKVADGVKENQIHLGQWMTNGSVNFSNIDLRPVELINKKTGDIELGNGESISDKKYLDTQIFSSDSSNIHRTISEFTAGFNTNRWLFGDKAYVIYHYKFPFALNSGKVNININYYVSGILGVYASENAANWKKIGERNSGGSLSLILPTEFDGKKELFIKLAAEGSSTQFQVNGYNFAADVNYNNSITGSTLIIDSPISSKDVVVKWNDDNNQYIASIINLSNRNIPISVQVLNNNQWTNRFTGILKPSQKKQISIRVTKNIGVNEFGLRIVSNKKKIYNVELQKRYSANEADNFGYALGKTKDGSDFWWCEGAWKVGTFRKSPSANIKPIYMEAAKGEYEPAQLVIRAGDKKSEITTVSCSDLKSGNNKLNASNISLYEVLNVKVTNPTDFLGISGEYPDPLPPLKLPVSVSSNQNKAIRISVFVPANTPAGLYKGTVLVKINNVEKKLPIEVKVFDFVISKVNHLRSAFGLDSNSINQYHKLITQEQKEKVWDLYIKNFGSHRISPYSFSPNSDINISFTGEGAERRVVLDFTNFDKTGKQYLDGQNLNSFKINLQGLGGGTFYSREVGVFGGYKAGTPEYEMLMKDYLNQIEKHLIEKGWIDKAYVYWFDEPDAKDYSFVIEVNNRIKKYAPRLKRLLTEQPEEALIGHVDIWCAVTQLWRSKQVIDERVKAGDEAWWYICVQPVAPYIGEFIDHPGVEMRLWPWQSWQYDIAGILIWESVYWTSFTAFPDSLQNPYLDPASYVSGYGTPKGTKETWGNGDGRYLYPPMRDPNTPSEPIISNPINTVRWENLRDGMEDYEYFWMLKDLINKKTGKASAKLIAEAKTLLVVPENVSKDLTNFNFNPLPLLNHRHKIGLMIEKLSK